MLRREGFIVLPWQPVRVNEVKEINLSGKTLQTVINHTFYLLTVTGKVTVYCSPNSQIWHPLPLWINTEKYFN